MKKCFSVSVILILLSLLAFAFSGCIFGGEDEEDIIGPGGEGEALAGLASMKAGSWEELVSPDGTRDRNEFLGTDTYKGVECYLLEFETIRSGVKEITQIWINKSTNQGVLLVMKDENGNVTKMELTPTTPTEDIPSDEVPPSAVKIGTKKYTTPTGKTVNATAYKMKTQAGESEFWVSSEVPFGQVKNIINGKVDCELYDFGFSGAKRDISKQEMENASSFGLPDGNGGGVMGDIKITVGAGARPEIKVSQPITSLMLTGPGITWGFISDDDQPLPGPFKYGVIPNGAMSLGAENPPDLKTGTQYTITVTGKGDLMGILVFVR